MRNERRARREAGEPPRPCHHPHAAHQHGTRAAYVHDRCRCRSCADANAAASTARTREQTYGRWSPFVDAEPLRQHIARLRSHGIGINRIAELAGLSPSHIRALIYPRGEGAPTVPAGPRRDRRPAAARAARPDRPGAAQPDPGHRNPPPLAGASRDRLAGVVAGSRTRPRFQQSAAHPDQPLGHPRHGPAGRSALRPDLEHPTRAAHPSRTRRRRRCATDRRPQALAATAGLGRHRHRPRPSARPSEPDTTPDDLDEIAIERALAGDGIGLAQLTRAEQDEAVRRLTEHGRSLREIAELLATTTRTISRRRKALTAA